ncbi:ribulose-phosphate 3-epimerase [Pectinatus frisingensis]|uniref:ribulose-phosphate 3-epimerase n=1 Tax=Pectinatus frisingensis TaxID=865 RepID=UPI0018C711BC|nr:ribulose-phosphate 3-epimerase [Pectinatus frisingensis]
MIEIIPSLFNADILSLKEDLAFLENNHINYLHVDMMDGNYVPNISFGPDQIAKIKNNTSMLIDVHMMVANPERILYNIINTKVDLISLHYESTVHLNELLKRIKGHGIKAGVALNPSTSPQVLEYLIDGIDYVLLMSINPGYWSQEFISSTYKKIEETKKILTGTNIKIEIDGKMNPQRIKKASKLGAELFVVGSYLFSDNKQKNLASLLNIK